MILIEWKRAEKKLSELQPKEVALCIVLPFWIAFICMAIANVFDSEVRIMSNIGDSIFIKENSGRVPLILLLIPFCFFLLASIQRLTNFCPKLATEYFVKGIAIVLPIFFISVFLFNYYIENKLTSKGYSYCSWYTGPSFRAPDVWLKNETLCLQSGSLIRSDIEEFFEGYNIEGTAPTLAELEMFIAEAKQAREDYIGGL
ncbi:MULTISPECIES: DUF1240 domain-containing protein [unclassified Shewanella]|uniref:DUF1240 domain-containing protein n=1 Tax=unclassified Shewanella TaxID=196818 RepID=UPI0035528216